MQPLLSIHSRSMQTECFCQATSDCPADLYNADSLKALMREFRGRLWFCWNHHTKAPPVLTYMCSLRYGIEYFQSLASADESAVTSNGMIFIITKGEKVTSTSILDISAL